ncbi:MAG: potassium channel family protein [Dehalococcoidia bacterium]|nr:potassium channel family protein [Dehalococcoidia bacterium]
MTEKVSKAELAMGFLAILSILLVVLGNMMIAKGRFPLGVYAIDLFICVVFAWDFAKRLKSAESRHEFWKKSWYEPLAMIPAVALQALAGVPALSAGLRVLRLIRVARIVLVASRLKRSFSVADRFVERSQLLYLILVTAGIVIAAAFAVLALEFDAAGSQVRGISDALWWSLSTVTTVGYGDIVPMTPLGRIIGMVLMVVGIGVMATLISQVSATLVESRLARRRKPQCIESDVDISSLQSTVARVRDLSDTELAALLRDLVRLQTIGRHSDTR